MTEVTFLEDPAYIGIKNSLIRTILRNDENAPVEELEKALDRLLSGWKTEEEKGGVCITWPYNKENQEYISMLESCQLISDIANYAKSEKRLFGIQVSPFLVDKSQIEGPEQIYRIYSHNSFFEEAILGKNLAYLSIHETKPSAASLKKLDEYKSHDIFDKPNKMQLLAIEKALHFNLSIISGGPGTGKTSSVVRVLEALLSDNPEAVIYLTAPTGKAKSRLLESIIERPNDFPLVTKSAKEKRLLANTIHMWLATNTSSGKRPGRNNPLECDILIIDEASMMDSTIAYHLFNAVDMDRTKVIILGDMYQLAAVGPGAIYADVSSPDGALKKYLTVLTESHRFNKDSDIGQLATAINRRDLPEKEQLQLVQNLLGDGKASPYSLQFKDVIYESDSRVNRTTELTAGAEVWLKVQMEEYCKAINKFLFSDKKKSPEDLQQVWKALNTFKPIAAVRNGTMSVSAINNFCEKQVLSNTLKKKDASDNSFYNGKVIIIRRNDLMLGVSNGDVAFVFEEDGQWNAYIGDTQKIIKAVLLPEYDTAFAITIHQSQGSGYDNVGVFLPFMSPNEDSQSVGLATRELFYTAVTRAKKTCTIFGTKEIVALAVKTKTKRSGGLTLRLQDFLSTKPPANTKN